MTNPQINQLQEVKPDFAVKTPMSYTKTGEINFPYDTKAHCYKLANGQRVIIVPQEGETVLRTYVNTGSMNEPDNIRGISHYIEHNLFNGSEGLQEGDFFKQVDKMGASTNASTGFAETNYFISSNLLNETDLENKIKLHASMLETPLFAVEKLEKEKGIVNSEINMITANPVGIAINKMLKNLYGIKSKSVDMIGGTTDNITNLTREDVINYYNNNYYPANMVTVITGEVKPEETMSLISKYFTSKRQPKAKQHFETFNPIQKAVREDIISDKATATSVIVGFNGPASNNIKDRIYTSALSILLSNSPASRINTKLKPLNAAALSEQEKISSNPSDGRVLMFISESVDENSEKVLKTIFNEIGNIPVNPPTEKEMQIVKKMMLKAFSDILENSFATNDIIGTSMLENNSDFLKNYEQIVNEMTAEDLVNTAKKYLDVNKVSVSVVHPASVTEETIKQNYKNVSFTGAKKQALNPDTIKEYQVQNNYRVITQNSKTDNVSILYKICLDNDIVGKPSAALILSRLLNEGSGSKTQEELDADLAQDGILKVITANESAIACSMDCDVNSMKKGFENIKEIVENPRFTQESFELAKSTIRDNILTAQKSAFDKLNKEYFDGTVHGYSNQEILEDLKTVTLDDVKDLHKQLLKTGKGMVAIAAPFNRKPELRNEVFETVAKFPKVREFKPAEIQKIYKPTTETKVLTDTNFKNQAEIVEAYKFNVNGNIKDSVSLNLLNIILGGNPSSRLFMDLREKEKLAYNVKSAYRVCDDTGVFTLKIGTTTENKDTGETSFDNVQKSIEGFNRHIAKIKSEKVTEEELANAKLSLKNTILNSNNGFGSKNVQLVLGLTSPYGIFKNNKIFEEIDKITAEDLYNAANYVFAGKPTYSIVATENTLNANKEFLNSLVG